MVGISTDTTRHRQALRLAKKAKANGCTVVMGGPHPGYVDEEILSTKRVDFIVRGEGEVTFSELVAALEKKNGQFDSIQGISFFSNGELVRTAPRPFIEDLDSLPLPARHLIHIGRLSKDKNRRPRHHPLDHEPWMSVSMCFLFFLPFLGNKN